MKSYENKGLCEQLLLLMRDLANRRCPDGYESIADVASTVKSIFDAIWEKDFKKILEELDFYTSNTNGRVDYQDLLVETLKFPYQVPIRRDDKGNEFPLFYSGFSSAINDLGLVAAQEVRILDCQNNKRLEFVSRNLESEPDQVFAIDFKNGEFFSLVELELNSIDGLYEIPFTKRYARQLGYSDWSAKRCVIVYEEYAGVDIGYFVFDSVNFPDNL